MILLRDTVWDLAEATSRDATDLHLVNYRRVYIKVWNAVNEPVMNIVWDEVLEKVEEELDETSL